MSSAGAADAQPPPEVLAEIAKLLDRLLPATISVACFASRWLALRGKLVSLEAIIREIAKSPHWSENALLTGMLPAVMDNLRRTESLVRECCGDSVSRGKLFVQSDLDIAAGWIAKQIGDLALVLGSGVLNKSRATSISPKLGESEEELAFFVRESFARLQIGGTEVKRRVLESLVRFQSEVEKSAGIVAEEGNLCYLISLLSPNVHDSVRELAATAVSLLACSGDSPRRRLFEEGAVGPLLRLADSGSSAMKEKAAVAMESITADPRHARAISAYGGVAILIGLCKSGSPSAQSHAVGSLKNAAAVEELRASVVEEGGVALLFQTLVAGNASAVGKSANCISILASSGDHYCNLLLQEKALQRLIHLCLACPTSDTLEHVLRAIHSLSISDSASPALSSSTAFVIHLSELVKYGNLRLQFLAASLLAKLSISDENKVEISGSMSSLVKLMASGKPDGVQEIGALVLVSLLSVKSNRKEFVRLDSNVARLVEMMDVGNDAVSKRSAVMVVSAVVEGGSRSCRSRLVDAGAYEMLVRLSRESDVPGAYKALQRLSPGNWITGLLLSGG